jgi:hypothetical protein
MLLIFRPTSSRRPDDSENISAWVYPMADPDTKLKRGKSPWQLGRPDPLRTDTNRRLIAALAKLRVEREQNLELTGDLRAAQKRIAEQEPAAAIVHATKTSYPPNRPSRLRNTIDIGEPESNLGLQISHSGQRNGYEKIQVATPHVRASSCTPAFKVTKTTRVILGS